MLSSPFGYEGSRFNVREDRRSPTHGHCLSEVLLEKLRWGLKMGQGFVGQECHESQARGPSHSSCLKRSLKHISDIP